MYRFRLPPWRRFGPLFEEAPELSLFFPIELVLAIVSAFLGALVLPFLAAVVRQLELGYNRVEPHNAVFEGFAGP